MPVSEDLHLLIRTSRLEPRKLKVNPEKTGVMTVGVKSRVAVYGIFHAQGSGKQDGIAC